MSTPEPGRHSPECHGGVGPLVFYEYCISFVFWTLRRPGRLVRLRPGERGLLRGLPYALVSLLLGWWGVPWGLVYTPLVLWTDLTGGRAVSAEELRRWDPGQESGVRGQGSGVSTGERSGGRAKVC